MIGRRLFRPVFFLCAIVGAGLLGGCTTTTVQPWERATLTTYSMRDDRDPVASMMAEHSCSSREAA